MKPRYGILLIVILLTFIELLHINKHDDYCKTEAEWERLNK